MFTDRRAELLLYRGGGPLRGDVGKGLYDENDKHPAAVARYNHALSLVLELLDTGHFYLAEPLDSVVTSPIEARPLIDYASSVYPGAHGFLRLHEYQHEKVRFSRGIVFPGAVKEQRDDIIELLKGSGFEAKNSWRQEALQRFGVRAGHHSAQKLLASENFHIDRLWRRNLRFL